jgi:hypothetical protein
MAGPRPRETIIFEEAHLIFKNFTGEGRKYNKEGDMNFSIMLSEDLAVELLRKELNIKELPRREEDDQQHYHLPVAVQFKNYPPRIWLVSNIDPETGVGRNKTLLGPGMCGILDKLESTRVDLVISPYRWRMDNGDTGIKAYLQTLYFTMYEDELERKYAALEQISSIDAGPQKELEPGSRVPYDHDGTVVDDAGNEIPEWTLR